MPKTILLSMMLIAVLSHCTALAGDPAMDPWELIGAEDPLLNGINSSGSLLFATTEEGFHSYNMQTQTWTDRTWPGWIGKSKYAVVQGQTHADRLVSGGVNAWFKGTLFYSDDMGDTETLVIESNGGKVTDLGAALFGDPALYACTWSDIVDGELLHSGDDGESWSLITGHGHHAMTDLAVLSSDEVFLAGDNYVTHTTDGGLTWNSLRANLPEGQGIYCVLAMPLITGLPGSSRYTDAAILLASNDTGLYEYDFDTELWSQVLPASCRAVAMRHRAVGMVVWSEIYAVTWDGRVMLCVSQDWDHWVDVTDGLGAAAPLDVDANPWGVFVAKVGGGVDRSDGWDAVTDVPDPGTRMMMTAYPNPFNPATTFRFESPAAGYALLQVFDLRGGLVATLLDGEIGMGSYTYDWRPVELGSGVYRAVLRSGGQTVSRTVVLLQ